MASQRMQESTPTDGLVRRDRSWLYPENRKLRNLVSISLRNLSLTPTSSTRNRGHTIDDDALPNTLKSPAKISALREQKALSHSMSSSDLHSVAKHGTFPSDSHGHTEEDESPSNKKGRDGSDSQTPSRPHLAPQRRSTLEWAHASPQKRQKKLEQLTAERVADVFFSLHVDGIEEPIYISEVVERTMNPTFRSIDFSACGPGITRLASLEVRIWAQTATTGSWKQLFELSVDFRGLQYLGKNLDQCPYPFPPNTTVFHLIDGAYGNLLTRPEYVSPSAFVLNQSSSSRALFTSSFDALLRLAKLDDSIQDALATKNILSEDLEKIIESNKQAMTEHDLVAEGEDRLKTINFAKQTVEKQLEKARRQLEERRKSLRQRKDVMIADRAIRETAALAMQKAKPLIPHARYERSVTEKAIRNQRRRICENLQECYPIRPLPKQALAFTVRDLHLPNSEALDSEQPETVAAALGHVAHVLQLLSFYFERPLTYPVAPKGSSSNIYDFVSMLKTNASITQTYKDVRVLRTYPLFPKGVPRFRFEYAVFLLNKNIQVLLESVYNVRVLDIRHTLPNLLYLLYVATAVEGELPARKAGGIRGLLHNNKTASAGSSPAPPLSRAGSNDSQSSALSNLLWQGNGKAKGGNATTAVEKLKKTMRSLDESITKKK